MSRLEYGMLAVLTGGLLACGPLPSNLDAMSAVDRGDPGIPVLSLRWRFQLADRAEHDKPQEFASPAISDRFQRAGRMYVGSNDGRMYALESNHGRVLWEKKLGAVSSRPLVYRGRIYVGTDDGTMYCLDEADGDIKWKYATRGAILETPVIVDDAILFSNEADHVYALARHDGAFRWTYKIETPDEFTLRGHAGIAIVGDMAVTGFADGSLVALRAASGGVVWKVSLRGDDDRFVDVDSTPVVLDDVIYATSSSGGLFSVSQDGEIGFRYKVKGAGPVVSDGQALYVAAANEGLHAIDKQGNLLWRQGTHGAGEPGVPALTESYIALPLSDSGLYVADKRTGRVVQYFDPGSGVSASPTLIGDEMYVLSNGAILYAFRVADD